MFNSIQKVDLMPKMLEVEVEEDMAVKIKMIRKDKNKPERNLIENLKVL